MKQKTESQSLRDEAQSLRRISSHREQWIEDLTNKNLDMKRQVRRLRAENEALRFLIAEILALAESVS